MADNKLTDVAIPALLGVDTAANDRYLVIDMSDTSRDLAGSPHYQEHSELVASLDLNPLVLTANPGQTSPILSVVDEFGNIGFSAFQQDLYSGSSPVDLDDLMGVVFSNADLGNIVQGTIYAQGRRKSDGATAYVQAQGGKWFGGLYSQVVLAGTEINMPWTMEDGGPYPFYVYTQSADVGAGYTAFKLVAQPGQSYYELMGLYQTTDSTSNMLALHLISPTTGQTVIPAFYIRPNGRMYDYAPDSVIHPDEMPAGGGLTRRWNNTAKTLTISAKAADGSMWSWTTPAFSPA